MNPPPAVRIRINWGSFAKERKASRCTVLGVPAFLHHSLSNRRRWTVTEAETGCAMGHGITSEAAIAHAEERIESAGGSRVIPELRRKARADGRAFLEVIG